jgi:hypothetical protein
MDNTVNRIVHKSQHIILKIKLQGMYDELNHLIITSHLKLQHRIWKFFF